LHGQYDDRTVHAMYSPTRHLPRKVRAFIDFLLDEGERADARLELAEALT
jgi:DNA-binding transcriptional LysR family regulator